MKKPKRWGSTAWKKKTNLSVPRGREQVTAGTVTVSCEHSAEMAVCIQPSMRLAATTLQRAMTIPLGVHKAASALLLL